MDQLEMLVEKICKLDDVPMSASELWMKGYEPRHRDLVKHIDGLMICFRETGLGSGQYEFGCIMKDPHYDG